VLAQTTVAGLSWDVKRCVFRANGGRVSDLVIKPVTSRRLRKQFLELPWTLYRDDPCWIPPLRLNQKELVGYRHHPFYDDAEAQTFLAIQGGRPCGRILAILNHSYNRWQNEEQGFFGFFESVDDPQVASGLFDAARDWLSERNIHSLRGPVNPSLNYECGLLIDGFDTPPFFMMTYNHPYYQQLIEGYGFGKAQDLFAFWGHVDMLNSLDKKLAFMTDAAAERFDIRIRPMDKSRFRVEMELFLDVYNRSLGGTWGFAPLSRGEIRHMGAAMRHLIVPELALMAEVDGKAVGVVFALLDYNPLVKQIDGRLFPFGAIRLLRKRHELKRVRMISTNVVPEYQRWGIGLVLLKGLVPKIMDWGIQEAEFSWVLESNNLSRGSLKKGGAKLTKTYRIFDFPPTDEP